MQTFESWSPLLKLSDLNCTDLASCLPILQWSNGEAFDNYGYNLNIVEYVNGDEVCTRSFRNQRKLANHNCKWDLTFICEFDCNNGKN